MLRSRDNQLFVSWPFLVRFRLNLGLNSVRFVHESISAVHLIRFEVIKSNRSNRIALNPSLCIESIASIATIRLDQIKATSEMDLWTNSKLFRPKLSLNWTQTGLSGIYVFGHLKDLSYTYNTTTTTNLATYYLEPYSYPFTLQLLIT